MKKHYISSLLFLLLSFLSATAQRLTPEQTGGVYYAYPVKEAARINVPEGMQVFYISHYGRHGSRWVTGKGRYKYVYRHFSDDSNLTPLGKEIKARLRVILKNAKGRAGDLTELGKQQHSQIARRMAKNYPEVFEGDAVVDARSSVSPRCRESMKAFCGELKSVYPTLSLTTRTKKADMAYISYDSPDQKELNRNTKREPTIDTSRFLSSLFIDTSVVKSPPRFLYEFHSIASDMQDIPLDVSLWDALTYEEMMSVHDSNNERMVICNGIDEQNHGIPAQSALSLWKHIETTADKYISENRRGASLLFGHDTPLYRFMTLLRLSLPSNGMEDVLPMAANLQIIFMKDVSNKIYVAFLHNEKLQHLPIEQAFPGIYRWNDVKQFVNETLLLV